VNWDHTSTRETSGGKKIRIKTQRGKSGLEELEAKQVDNIIAVSKLILRQVIAWVKQPTTYGYSFNTKFSHFFRTESPPTVQELQSCLIVLEKTFNGINSTMDIKASPYNPAHYGYVNYMQSLPGFIRGIVSRRHTLGNRAGKIVSRGDIHIARELLSPLRFGLALVVFLHEATHKYGNTEDHAEKGYMNNNGLAYQSPGLTTKEALKNADSYAWFCYAMQYR
jgi:hypothetical protein